MGVPRKWLGRLPLQLEQPFLAFALLHEALAPLHVALLFFQLLAPLGHLLRLFQLGVHLDAWRVRPGNCAGSKAGVRRPRTDGKVQLCHW